MTVSKKDQPMDIESSSLPTPNDITTSLQYLKAEVASLKSFQGKLENVMTCHELTKLKQQVSLILETTQSKEQDSIISHLQMQVEELIMKTARLEFQLKNSATASPEEAKSSVVNQHVGNGGRSRLDRQRSVVAKFFPSLHEELEEETRTMPESSYSFTICSKPRSWSFFTGIIVFLLQIGTTCLLCLDLLNFSSALTQPIRVPANVDNVVRIAQFLAIIFSILVQDDIRVSLEQLLEGYDPNSIGQVFEYSTAAKFWVVCSCQFFEAVLVLMASFLLIVTSENIASVLLNFTAVGFVSILDKVAFQIVAAGFFGEVNRRKAKEISNNTFQIYFINKKRRVGRVFLFVMYCFMVVSWGLLVHTQVSGMYLCKQIHVQFSDQLAAFSGVYDMHISSSRHGRVDYVERRRRSTGSDQSRGRFSFCSELNAWTFSDNNQNDSCDWKAKSSVLSQYDLTKTLSIPWEFMGTTESAAGGFQLSCFDNKNCFGETCTCQAETYGLTCDFQYQCAVLSTKARNSFTEFQQKFKILQLNGSEQNASIQAYHRPIYVSPQDDNFTILIFTGFRWILTTTSALLQNAEAFSGLRNVTSPADIAAFFHSGIFHALDLPPDSVMRVSEAAVGTASTVTPINLQWYYPQYYENKERGLPLPDITRPDSLFLFCAYCDDKTNPCAFEGECNKLDGICECKHGAKGSLCEEPPTGDGVCNPFFNNLIFDYDGGDCCGATCKDTSNCGIDRLRGAFGTDMYAPSHGYPECSDPSMVPVSIEIEASTTWFLGLELVCGDTTYMKIPVGAIIEDLFKGTEVIFVNDGTECKLTITADEMVINSVATYSIEVFYRNLNDTQMILPGTESNSLIGKAKGIARSGGVVEIIPFVVIKRCLFNEIPNVDQNILIENTPQGKALRWLNSDASERSSCRGKSRTLGLQQRYALSVLNFATNDMLRNTSNTWLSDAHECDWRPGIICTTGDLITEINLYDLGLTGVLPSEIGLLQSLERVDFGYNKLTNRIPTEIGKLSSLERFSINNNRFFGPLPSEMGNLVHLDKLYLGRNGINGKIPSELGNLIHLRQFSTTFNRLTGEIPSSFFKLTNVEQISFVGNKLSGKLSAEVGNLKNLRALGLSSNSFTGKIPAEIESLSKLETLIFYDNGFTGSIPKGLFSLRNLEIFSLANNNLVGTIGTEIGNLVNIVVLKLFGNALTGTIPTSVGKLINMAEFAVQLNHISGPIPSEIGDLQNLGEIRLNNNLLSGTIPKELDKLSILDELRLSSNDLSGTISANMCQIDGLELLVIDCDSIKCPPGCKCRGIDEVQGNYYSCSYQSKPSSGCNDGFMMFNVELVNDYFPNETTWDLAMNGTTVLNSDSGNTWACMQKSSCGLFTIHDNGGNGICCRNGYGYGSYTLFLDDEIIAYGGKFLDVERVSIGPPSCTSGPFPN